MAKRTEKGVTLVLFTLIFVFVVVPLAALAIDLPSVWTARRDRQKLVDAACLAAAIAAQNGGLAYDGAVQNFTANGADPTLWSPNEGEGVTLSKGIEVGTTIRTAMWGPTLSWWSHLIPGVTGWEMGARAQCKTGLGGFLPLALHEWLGPNSKILQTSDPNDYWSGPCTNQSIDPSTDPATRPEPNCWVWGDWQILAGDGHRPNEGDVSMNGLIAPDVRCEIKGQACTSKVYIPPVPEGVQVNTLKKYTMGYIAAGGYDGPLPIPGTYTGVNSALIAQQEGISNKFLAQEIGQRYNVGDLLVVFVYQEGQLFDGDKNFDYVEVIGYAVVRVVYIDANTVAVTPVYPATNQGDPSIEDDLPKSPWDIAEGGFDLYPVLIPWD